MARLTTSATAIVALFVAPALAQGHGGGHAGPPATHGNPHATTSSPKTTTTTTTGSSSTTTATSGTTSGGTTSGGTTSGTTKTTVSPIAQKISSHPQLASKCTALLPTGMTLNQAATGFRNQGQFIAALHVSRNLNIPFAQLKATMLGTSPTPSTPGTQGTSSGTTTTATPMSLGQAIHKLRPSIDSDDAAEHATTQASTDLKTTSSTSTATTSTHR